jgi:hypothetical protein
MPPHCDSIKGPVVTAARKALDADRVDLVLPYVKKAGEDEIRKAFALVRAARNEGAEAKDVADRFFFETVVRVHRAGEGAPYTGLKIDADEGPVIPVAERAIERHDIGELATVLGDAVRHEAQRRLDEIRRLESRADGDVDRMREYVESVLGLQVWAHGVHLAIEGGAHGGEHHHGGA